MKKVFFILVFALSTMSFLPIEDIQDIQDIQEIQNERIENVECKYRQCNATAKSTGKRCKHCVSKSRDYQCYQHKPK
ncbi:hypothetical protein OAD49_05125 [Flavobacteriaceae bacterium]|nr:hypothetical protein [Flavobacteriaceae bacterium]